MTFLIFKGDQWRFMVSLHAGVIHNQTEIFMVPKLFCTGSIISPQFVITAGGL